MPNIVEIADLSAPELDVYARLTEAQLRARLTPEKGLFIAESPKVIGYALDTGYQPVSLLMERRHIAGKAAPLLERCGGVPVYTADSAVLERLTGYPLTRGVLCAMRRPVLPAAEAVCTGARRVAVLEGITEPSNVGAIFRSAAALKADAIVLSPTCCDPLHRRAVRVCMGAIFQVPWARAEGSEALPLLKEAGFTVVGLALRENCLTLDDPRLPGIPRMAICLGTEDTGLAEATLDACDHIVKIPMAGGIDSLNVAAAAAVAFWQLRVREKSVFML